MRQYQELGDEAVASPTTRATLDAGGSTVDQIFTDAIMSVMPTLVVEQRGVMRGYEAEGQADIVTVPVFKNFDLTFTNLSGTGSDTGSLVATTAANAITYVKIQPVLWSGGIFVTDTALLTVNAASFNEHIQRVGVAAQRYMDRTILNNTLLSETAVGTAYTYAAGGFTANGSVAAGSTLGPFDLSDAKSSLSTGSDPYVPNAVLMHPTQYNDLLQSNDFRNDTYRVSDKAKFVDGELVSYDGMEIIVTELINAAAAAGVWGVTGRRVAVFNKNISAALAKKSAATRVRTWEDIRRHGTYIYVDMMFDAQVLIPESVRIIRCAGV